MTLASVFPHPIIQGPTAGGFNTPQIRSLTVSGVESGGHRGTFIGAQEDAALGTFELLPQVVVAVKLAEISTT